MQLPSRLSDEYHAYDSILVTWTKERNLASIDPVAKKYWCAAYTTARSSNRISLRIQFKSTGTSSKSNPVAA